MLSICLQTFSAQEHSVKGVNSIFWVQILSLASSNYIYIQTVSEAYFDQTHAWAPLKVSKHENLALFFCHKSRARWWDLENNKKNIFTNHFILSCWSTHRTIILIPFRSGIDLKISICIYIHTKLIWMSNTDSIFISDQEEHQLQRNLTAVISVLNYFLK